MKYLVEVEENTDVAPAKPAIPLTYPQDSQDRDHPSIYSQDQDPPLQRNSLDIWFHPCALQRAGLNGQNSLCVRYMHSR